MPSITIPSQVKEEPHYSPAAPAAPAPPAQQQPATDYFDHKLPRSRSSSPERPPVSPITPVTSHTDLTSLGEKYVPPTIPPPEFIPAPKPEPIREWNENEDVLALRSAISLLQMQREKAKKDLVALEHVKQTAIADPDGYLQELKTRRTAQQKPKKTLADILGPAEADILASTFDDEDDEDDEEHYSNSLPGGDNAASTLTPKFQTAPQPQNIVRCPPINWAKYHVVGDTLDKMHAEQMAKPNFDATRSSSKAAPQHHIAAPFNPFTDRNARTAEQHSTQTKKSLKKPNT